MRWQHSKREWKVKLIKTSTRTYVCTVSLLISLSLSSLSNRINVASDRMEILEHVRHDEMHQPCRNQVENFYVANGQTSDDERTRHRWTYNFFNASSGCCCFVSGLFFVFHLPIIPCSFRQTRQNATKLRDTTNSMKNERETIKKIP